MKEDTNKMRTYETFKNNFKPEKYLCCVILHIEKFCCSLESAHID